MTREQLDQLLLDAQREGVNLASVFNTATRGIEFNTLTLVYAGFYFAVTNEISTTMPVSYEERREKLISILERIYDSVLETKVDLDKARQR